MAIEKLAQSAFMPQISKIAGSASQNEFSLGKTKSAVSTADSFGDFLAEGVSKVNRSLVEYEDLSAKFSQGESVNIHELMLKGDKADMNLRLVVAFRNKVVEAYQEIMRMGI